MDRITRVRIENVRAIERLDLELGNPLTVLIGENGSGKSTILECLELLRKAADPNFMQLFYTQHRGMPGLLRHGAAEITLGLRVEDTEGNRSPLDYGFTLRAQSGAAVITAEALVSGDAAERATPEEPKQNRRGNAPRPRGGSAGRTGVGSTRGMILSRKGAVARAWNDRELRHDEYSPGFWDSEQLMVNSFGNHPPSKTVERLLAVLRGIEVHLGFDTLASWAAQSVQRPPTLRGTGMLLPARRLNLLGHNLVSAWFALKNVDEAHWTYTMDLVRLGLGENVDSINTIPDAGGGHVSLSLKRKDLSEAIPAANLSDGQLSWLAFVAMARLNSNRSLLAVDEPELHMHPSLLGRVVSLLANLDGNIPAVLSTHSDRVLEMLDEPVDALRVCSLEGSKAVVSRIDAEALPQWLEEFGDVGQLRASGYLPRVLIPLSTTPVASTEGRE